MRPDGALIKEITVKLDSQSVTRRMGSLFHADSPKDHGDCAIVHNVMHYSADTYFR